MNNKMRLRTHRRRINLTAEEKEAVHCFKEDLRKEVSHKKYISSISMLGLS